MTMSVELTTTLDGSAVYPHDADYADVASWPVRTDDQRMPGVVARCVGAADVAKVVSFARDTGIPLAMRGGGHSFAGHSRTEGVLIDTALMGSAWVDGERAVIGAGATLGPVYDALHAEGRTIPAGCGPTVGIAGLTLSGGLGVLGRVRGFTCDALVEAEIVLADGTVTRCSADRDADLFWALRGGGAGSFGVVTELMFATVPEPAATGFHITGPLESAAQVLDAWQRWLPGAPDEVAASLQLSTPSEPSKPMRLGLLGAVSGPERFRMLDDAAQSWGEPRLDRDVRDGQLRTAKGHLAEVGERIQATEAPTTGAVTRFGSAFVDAALPGPVVSDLVALVEADRRPGQRRELDLMPMGGAYNRVPPEATAFTHRQDLFLLKYSCLGPEAETWVAAVAELLAPHVTTRVYQNFADATLSSPLSAYYGDNLPRLVDVKSRYDPEDLFRHAQSIPTRFDPRS